MRRFWSWIFICNAVVTSALAADGEETEWNDETVALAVHVVHRNGAKFDGLVVNTASNQRLFPGQAAPDLSTSPPDEKLTLEKFNGLSGSITLTLADCRAIEVVSAVAGDELNERDRQSRMVREQRWNRERDRLARLGEARAASATAAAAAALAATEEDGSKLPPELQSWIDRFPPAEGWVPAKKAQLYYQQFILDTHKPTDRERDWLDHYDDWKVAYDAWTKLEQEKAAAAESAAANAKAGEPTSTAGGAPAPASSGTGAGSDPDAPTPEEKKSLLPPLDETAPKPTPVPEDAPKPTPTGGGGDSGMR